MGLDVTAYSKLHYLPAQPKTEEEREALYDIGKVAHCYNANGYDRLSPQAEGFYSPKGQEVSIACGAYSRYNRWRENLARLAGYPLGEYEQYGAKWPSHTITACHAESGPFWELINFGDNDGTIGEQVSAKLSADFQYHEKGMAERAALMEDKGAEFMRFYTQWAAAFNLAADGGAVVFH